MPGLVIQWSQRYVFFHRLAQLLQCVLCWWGPVCGGKHMLHFMYAIIDPAPQDVTKTTRWNNIRDAIGMH
jgi:hypothetical protein